VGPALGVVVATQVSSTVALLAVGVCMVVAGIALFVVDPPTRSAEAAEAEERAAVEDSGVRGVRSWFTPGLAAVLAASTAATLVLSGTDVGVVAVLRSHAAVTFTGVVFAAWSLGSMTGAAVYGALRRPVSPLVLLAGLAVLTIPVGLAPSPWLLALAILPAGALCAPVITATAEEVARRVPERVLGEAMGWHGSAMPVGIALGAPLAGSAIDGTGPWAGFAAVGVIGAVLAVVGLGVQHLVSGRSPRVAVLTGADVDVPAPDADVPAPAVDVPMPAAGVPVPATEPSAAGI
jgi:predicted MFS family arabinose efflux permease